MSHRVWYMVYVDSNLDYKFITALGIEQTIEHYNVLMKDLSVKNPSDNDIQVNQWLWATDAWSDG